MQAMVILVTVKLMVSTHTHTHWSLFWQLGSVTSFYLFFTFESLVPLQSSELYGTMSKLTTFITNYFLLFFFFAGFILTDLVVEALDRMIREKWEEDDLLLAKEQ